jgi:FkbM family methyltransferase
MAHVAMESRVALHRIVRRGLSIETVIDVGASDGSWSTDAMRFFPRAHYLLIEAQAAHQPALEAFVSAHQNARYVLKAAGETDGKVYFKQDSLFGGQASYDRGAQDMIEVESTSIDAEVAARRLPAPYLIKLDVHGYECPILRGATHTLRQTNLAVVECYNFPIAPESLMFYDMCRLMHEHGFRVVDISEPLWRPGDRAFWQIDFFFVRADRPEFASNTYA